MVTIFFIFILLGLLLLVYMFREAHLNIVRKHEFSFSNTPLEKPIRLFFISDIHRRKIHSSIISRMTNQVDLVIIGGDLLEKGVPLERIEQNIRKLSSLGPVYFVWGNNDNEIEKKDIEAIFTKWNVVVLKNSSVMVNHLQKEWALIGVDDLKTGEVDLDLAFQDVKQNAFKLLVSHNPRILKLLEMEHGVSLVLSGHTHGGQIRIFGYGPYEKGKTHVYEGITQLISNGYGTTSLPLRLSARPETHFIEIKSI
ncbi:metallophosphoesterase [Bacillus sp. AFS055030]|uniref:metallophosphoesterase n=1 Tax=Bacillus sp. AFS055030 TaxID=2033507 RepID=UPI000BFD0104|nr:metallophosphoesterase [Bacillus sp. AFS055030]PGL71384.1 metallophosphoesterase [Bacillus sp. AFS055030]